MEIRRTANAGILLTLDDTKILLDGVSQEVKPYLATPPAIKQELLSCPPDILLFTHVHEDHFDPEYCRKVNQPICSTSQVAEELSATVHTEKMVTVGEVKITSVPTRHMGHYGKTTEHRSFVLEGSQTVWFLGDASPMELKKFAGFSKPDVLIIPYPYVSTPAALKMVETFLPCKIVLLHMPLTENDPEKIWQSVQDGLEYLKAYLYVPALGEILNL